MPAPPGHLVEASSGECRGRRPSRGAESGSAQRAAAVRGVRVRPCAPGAPASSQPAPSRGRGRPAPGTKQRGGGTAGRAPGPPAGVAAAGSRARGRGPGRAGRRPLRPPAAPYLSWSARPRAPAALPAALLLPPRPQRRAPRGRRLRGAREVVGGGGSLGPPARPRAPPALALRAAPVAARAAAPPPRPLGPPPSPPAAQPSPPPRPLPSPVPPSPRPAPIPRRPAPTVASGTFFGARPLTNTQNSQSPSGRLPGARSPACLRGSSELRFLRQESGSRRRRFLGCRREQ